MRKFSPALALAVLASVPALVAQAADPPVVYKACEKTPSKDDTEAAKGLFKAGSTSYNEADYAKAIQYWRDAHERDCTADPLLLNLANAYEKSGNIDAAIASLETYLKRRPTDQDASTIQKRIENMRKLKAPAAPSSTPSATAAPPPPPPTQSAPPPPTQSATGDSGPGIAPLVVAGVGGVLTIAGVVVYLGGAKKVTTAEEACPDRKCPPSLANAQSIIDDGNKGRSQKAIGGVVAGVGVLGVAGGLTWYFLTKDQGKQGSATYLAPELSPGYAGFTAAGRF